jgi:hypothetical protein
MCGAAEEREQYSTTLLMQGSKSIQQAHGWAAPTDGATSEWC